MLRTAGNTESDRRSLFLKIAAFFMPQMPRGVMKWPFFALSGPVIITAMMQVSLDYILLLGSLVGELVITLIVGRKYAHRNLYQIVKGAD